MSHHVTSHHVTSYHVTSCQFISHHIMSCHIMSYHSTSRHTTLPLAIDHWFLLPLVMSPLGRAHTHITSYHSLSHHLLSPSFSSITPCYVISLIHLVFILVMSPCSVTTPCFCYFCHHPLFLLFLSSSTPCFCHFCHHSPRHHLTTRPVSVDRCLSDWSARDMKSWCSTCSKWINRLNTHLDFNRNLPYHNLILTQLNPTLTYFNLIIT